MKEKLKFKPLAIILILVIIFQHISMIVPFLYINSVAYGQKYRIELNGFDWEYDAYGYVSGQPTVSITRLVSYQGSNTVQVPSKIEDYNVGVIGESAFSYKNFITKIIIPNTVKIIENNAFKYCENLESINISNCTSIGSKAFYGCYNLQEVNLSNQLSTIENYVFSYCTSLEE